jgi:VIT1/CCC1 family predicted Fe2+/Mn2+ transporter
MSSRDPKRFLRYLEAERNAAMLYRALAETTDGERREALLELADIEDQHARHWEHKLTEYAVAIPPAPTSLPASDAALVARARAAGMDEVLARLEEAEGEDAGMYDEEPEALDTMPGDEREHAETFRRLRISGSGAQDASELIHPEPTLGVGGDIDFGETWHRADTSGKWRAAIFGISDGLVSNTALVMGFAGSGIDRGVVLFAGIAGLLAGAFSMAAGEYVSMASQRDLFRREIDMEARELAEKPEEEQRELELIYRAKGLDRETAKTTAARIMSDPQTALDTLVREELGLNPDELGSPIKAALFSFIAFAMGAFVVVVPYLFTGGNLALVIAIALAGLAMLVVGGAVGRYSGRGIWHGALRQLMVGTIAAGVTFAIGRIIGALTGLDSATLG